MANTISMKRTNQPKTNRNTRTLYPYPYPNGITVGFDRSINDFVAEKIEVVTTFALNK